VVCTAHAHSTKGLYRSRPLWLTPDFPGSVDIPICAEYVDKSGRSHGIKGDITLTKLTAKEEPETWDIVMGNLKALIRGECPRTKVLGVQVKPP
jgi:hypothetical protein